MAVAVRGDMAPRISSLLVPAVLAALGCTEPEEIGSDCEGDVCDDTPFKPDCASLIDRSGRGFLPASLATDRLVSTIYHGPTKTCTVKANEIVKALATQSDCKPVTQIISETDALLGGTRPDHRAVTSFTCGGETVFVSTFGFNITSANVPAGVEIITQDSATGVINYFKEVAGRMNFFGSSKDFILQGPAGKNLTDVRGCANCHSAGGLVMKEITTPWPHWEPGGGSPEVDKNLPQPKHFATLVRSRREWMGTQGTAKQLETVVENGNIKWNQTRIAMLRESGDVARLLEPLFCPLEVNIGVGGKDGSVIPEQLLSFGVIPGTSKFEAKGMTNLGSITAPANIDGSRADYDAIKAAIAQKVGSTGRDDTVMAPIFVMKAHIDLDYLDQLVAAKVLDQQLVQDVMMVDFTRPALSVDRCDLLSRLQGVKLDASKQTPAGIRDLLIEKLAGSDPDSAAGQLLGNLEASKAGKSLDHKKAVDDFIAACRARAQSEKVSAGGKQVSAFLADVMKLNSLSKKTVLEFSGAIAAVNHSKMVLTGATRRSLVGPTPVFEFDATMPLDAVSVRQDATPADLTAVDPDARLSPVDCKLTNEFVPLPR